jgi:hypothetical protein
VTRRTHSRKDMGRTPPDDPISIGARSTDDNVVCADGDRPSEIVVRGSIARDEDGLLPPGAPAQLKDVCCADRGRLMDIGSSHDGIVSIDRNRSPEIGASSGVSLASSVHVEPVR